MFQRGDIILVPFPFTDLNYSKRRPAIIISNEIVNTTGDVIIVMITSQDKKDDLQIEILSTNVSPSLTKRSFVRCHRIATIDINMILAKIGTADSDLLDKIEAKLHFLIKDEINPVSTEVIA